MKRLLALAVIILLAVVLRFYDLSRLPNGLYWDEQDTGYQAYSVIHTGRDYFGNPFPLFFHSFSDYRTPVFIYSDVPWVLAFGLTPFAVRLPAALFGLMSIILIYYLANLMFRNFNLFKTVDIGHVAALLLAVSPWHVLYGRQSVECNAMLAFLLLGIVAFYKGLKRPAWFLISGMGFGLAVASYSPAKFFVPLLLLALVVIYRIQLFPLRRFHFIALLVFAVISAPIIYDGFFGLSGTRFHDVSILTDPTVASQVDYQRQYSAAGSGREVSVGQSPRFIDKITYNKVQSIIGTFTANYLHVFSTQYLFTLGDQELRHSPNRSAIGQFPEIDVIPLVLGVICLGGALFVHREEAAVLGFWLLVGPIPSALTRDGGAHAARTFLMLPAFILVITLGIYYLFSKSRWLLLAYLVLLFFSSLNIYNYFFGIYRFESARPFQWGYDQAVNLALAASDHYPLVIVDLKSDSALMAYLFTTRMSPAKFQSLEPLPVVTLAEGVSGNQFGNILLLSPGSRAWTNIQQEKTFPKNTLIISDATQPLIDTQVVHMQTVLNPDRTPFLYTFVTR